jgi:hypothetical protein
MPRLRFRDRVWGERLSGRHVQDLLCDRPRPDNSKHGIAWRCWLRIAKPWYCSVSLT